MNTGTLYEPGDKIDGRYLIGQALKGGMGEVYLCYDDKERLPVAVKTLQKRLLSKPTIKQRFLQEAATWFQLGEHPNIVQAYYYDEDDQGYPYIVLEYVPGIKEFGTDLRSWLRHGPLDISLLLTWAIHIIQGMLHAQSILPGMAHGDLKPENLLITPQKYLKITDFGLVNVLGTEKSQVRNMKSPPSPGYTQVALLPSECGIVGTLQYMAPELWHGEISDSTSDIYAFGCILYEMLYGAFLFNGSTREEIRRKHLEYDPILPDKNSSKIGEIILKCVNKNPGRRYSNWTRLLKKITKILKGKPVLFDKKNYSSGYWWKWHNRGVSLYKLMRYEEALRHFDHALELKPDVVDTWLLHGRALSHLGCFREALASLEEAQKLGSPEAAEYIIEAKAHLASDNDKNPATSLENLHIEIARLWNDMKASGLHRERNSYALQEIKVPQDKMTSMEEIVHMIASNDDDEIADAVEIFRSLKDEEKKKMVLKVAFEYVRDHFTYYDAFADSFVKVGQPIIKYLINALEDKDWSVRYTAARALSQLDDPDATRHFVEWFFSDLEWELYEFGFEIKEGLADLIIKFAMEVGDKLLIKRIRNYWGPRDELEKALLKHTNPK